jgi:dimeric dUTPase (all-alpha-NTP-PPase superfamily)
LNNRSISEFAKNFSHISFDELFDNYMYLGKFLHVGKKYKDLTMAATHGNIAKTVEQLNAILAFK